MSPALERIPAPLRRMLGFVIAGTAIYGLFVLAATALYPSGAAIGTAYGLSAVLSAAIAAFYLVYLGGFARLRDLLP